MKNYILEKNDDVIVVRSLCEDQKLIDKSICETIYELIVDMWGNEIKTSYESSSVVSYGDDEFDVLEAMIEDNYSVELHVMSFCCRFRLKNIFDKYRLFCSVLHVKKSDIELYYDSKNKIYGKGIFEAENVVGKFPVYYFSYKNQKIKRETQTVRRIFHGDNVAYYHKKKDGFICIDGCCYGQFYEITSVFGYEIMNDLTSRLTDVFGHIYQTNMFANRCLPFIFKMAGDLSKSEFIVSLIERSNENPVSDTYRLNLLATKEDKKIRKFKQDDYEFSCGPFTLQPLCCNISNCIKSKSKATLLDCLVYGYLIRNMYLYEYECNIYNLIGTCDSVDREKMFTRISEILNIRYVDIYDYIYGDSCPESMEEIDKDIAVIARRYINSIIERNACLKKASRIMNDVIDVDSSAQSTPVAAELADDVTVAAELADDTPVAAELADDVTVAAELADDVTVAAELADDVTVAAELADDVTVAAELADDIPVADVTDLATALLHAEDDVLYWSSVIEAAKKSEAKAIERVEKIKTEIANRDRQKKLAELADLEKRVSQFRQELGLSQPMEAQNNHACNSQPMATQNNHACNSQPMATQKDHSKSSNDNRVHYDRAAGICYIDGEPLTFSGINPCIGGVECQMDVLDHIDGVDYIGDVNYLQAFDVYTRCAIDFARSNGLSCEVGAYGKGETRGVHPYKYIIVKLRNDADEICLSYDVLTRTKRAKVNGTAAQNWTEAMNTLAPKRITTGISNCAGYIGPVAYAASSGTTSTSMSC